jgi:hypothetical protein
MENTITTSTTVHNPVNRLDNSRYARCIEVSKRIRWDIDKDVIRGREFDFSQKFLPDSLSKIDELDFLVDSERRFLSQIQGRTYANIFGLVERYIDTKILEVGQRHKLGDPVAFEALMRFSEEEIKHQELFRRIDALAASGMPDGYIHVGDPDAVASNLLTKSTWAVLGLTSHIELFTQQHYKQSIQPCDDLSPLFQDVFFYHWQEESQHAILDELEWRAEDSRLAVEDRPQAIEDLIELVVMVDGLLQAQSSADAEYFLSHSQQYLSRQQKDQIRPALLRAYRWQYIVSGIVEGRFMGVLGDLTSEAEMSIITEALTPLLNAV